MCFFFGIIMIATLGGLFWYVYVTGFKPLTYVIINGKWEDDGEKFSWFTIAVLIMLLSFFFPMLLRPMDFVSYPAKYIFGLFSYLFMIPTYVNILGIYAMSNLHDISWGNRPAAG